MREPNILSPVGVGGDIMKKMSDLVGPRRHPLLRDRIVAVDENKSHRRPRLENRRPGRTALKPLDAEARKGPMK